MSDQTQKTPCDSNETETVLHQLFLRKKLNNLAQIGTQMKTLDDFSNLKPDNVHRNRYNEIDFQERDGTKKQFR
jgi:hypothetical protein